MQPIILLSAICFLAIYILTYPIASQCNFTRLLIEKDMTDRPGPKGRGALLEKLKKHKETTAAATVSAPGAPSASEPPKSRGRAALLEKIQQMKENRVGIGPADNTKVDILTRLSTAENRGPVESSTKKMVELQVVGSEEPCLYRGESGTPLRTAVNYIRLEIEKDAGVFEYEVRFQPDVDAKSHRFQLVNQALGSLSTTKVYDGGSCLYLPAQIFKDRQIYPGQLPSTQEHVDIIIIYKCKKKMSDCLHLYNVLFKRIMNTLLYKRMGKNYFSPNHKMLIPQHKLEVFPGYAITVDELEGGLMICLDTQHRVIRSQTVYELFHELKASDPRKFRELALNNLIGSCVMTNYNNKTYIVDDINWDLTPKNDFKTRDGSSCTFVNYYKQQYNITIMDVDQPMLISKITRRMGEEKIDQLICLVPELSYLTGLTDAMRADFKVMKDVAAHTRLTPNQRMLALRSYLDKVRNSELSQKILAGWGLRIADGTTDIQGRVLRQEFIYFGGSNTENTKYIGSDWNKAMADNRVTGPIDITNWLLFYTQKDQKYAVNFAQSMTRLAKGMGCIILEPRHIMLVDDRTETYMNAIKDHVHSNIQVCVFICPTLRSDRYSIIKKMCCVQIPIASQVILSKTLSNPKKLRTIIHKIALQITCKLGGTLWSVKMPVSWMVCGIDVYHGTNKQSVCGFVASINVSMTKYYSESLFQDREIGDFFKLTFKKAIVQYKHENGCLPSKVVIVRDGVGDGQLNHCLRYELPQFQEALNELNEDISLIMCVVQKRINTRLFHVIDEKNCDNPPSGTVVDSVITRRNLSDFYLVPQSVRQGTVNPTHYIVLYDNGCTKPDHVQRMMYKLCHLYYNWSGIIRVPAPCQYAHKLASLVGQYIKKTPNPKLSNKLFYL